METMKVDFDGLPWQCPAPGVREKAVRRGSQRLRLLEFAAGFEEREWCRSAHAFTVVEGSFALQFRNGREHFRVGDCVLLPAGEIHAHRAVVAADEHVRLLVFEVFEADEADKAHEAD
jgi:quercetin dioxygenase-like cupin family protein